MDNSYVTSFRIKNKIKSYNKSEFDGKTVNTGDTTNLN
jgi:hypothetical protein